MQKRSNRLALRVLSTAALMAMVSSIAAPAFAGTYYLENGDITVDAKEDGNHITQGDLYQDHLDEGKTIITDHKDESDTSAVSNTVTINVDDNATGDVTIKDANIDNSCGRYDTEKNGITVDTKGESSKANITLDNVTIKPGEDGDGGKNYGGAGLEVKGDGTANIELNGDNTLNGGICHAGVEKDDTKGTGNLIIKDDYNDDDSTKNGTEMDTAGSLTANGGFDGAGIGGGEYDDTSNIEISGGKVTATGGYDAAGIGGGKRGAAENIKISGGDIIASAGSGAGIGSGFDDDSHLYGGHANSIEITGGTIQATSGTGAGIGTGEQGDNVDITITGGNITAESRYGGAGIGTGDNAEEGATIKISGKDTVINADGATGIGNGGCTTGDLIKIDIEDGTITASGTVGIGVSDDSDESSEINISGGIINATGSSGAGIGNEQGNNDATVKINISGGTITANGGTYHAYYDGDLGSAGIGSGYRCDASSVGINITGGNITAIGGKGAAAIGGGVRDESGDAPDVKVKIDSSNRALKITAIVPGSREGAIGEGALYEYGSDLTDAVDFDDITVDSLGEEHGALVQFMNNYNAETGTGTLYKAIHNKKYIEETYNNPNDDHEWGNPQVIKEAAPGVQGIIRYTCVVDGCGAIHDVPYDYVEPEEPDNNDPTTPDTPDVPGTSDSTPGTPAQDTPADTAVTPDAVQADAAVTPAAVQNAVQGAKPEAAVTAAALPQTGVNWLAALASALSGVALLTAGLFLNRKESKH